MKLSSKSREADDLRHAVATQEVPAYSALSTTTTIDLLRLIAAALPSPPAQPATPAAVVAEVLRLREAVDKAEGEAARARASALESSATAAAVLHQAEVR